MLPENFQDIRQLCRLLSNRNRLGILYCLLQGICYPREIAQALNLPDTNVSHALSDLKRANFVKSETDPQNGMHQKYQLSDPMVAEFLSNLAIDCHQLLANAKSETEEGINVE